MKKTYTVVEAIDEIIYILYHDGVEYDRYTITIESYEDDSLQREGLEESGYEFSELSEKDGHKILAQYFYAEAQKYLLRYNRACMNYAAAGGSSDDILI